MARLPKPARIHEAEPYFVNIDGAALFLGIAAKTIRNQLSEGKFPVKPRRFGGRVLFELEALRAFARSLCQDS